MRSLKPYWRWGEGDFGGEVLQESALCRYEELTKPLVVGCERYFADTVQEALINIAARAIATEGNCAVFDRQSSRHRHGQIGAGFW